MSLRRRTLLTAGAAGTAAALIPAAAHASGAPAGVTGRLRDLERHYGAKLGVYARNLRTGRTVRHHADDLFPICSVFKTLAAAAVLRDLDRDGEFLARRIHYTEADLVDGSDKTREHLAEGMTVAELCDVTIRFSDNAAGNLLLRELGGPTAITRFARSLGDPVTRLDRWETELNSAEPWRVTDTTSPRAIGRTYARLVLGDALPGADRELLTHWLLHNTTSGDRLRAGVPPTWTVADKTGGGAYGTNNNVGIAWTPDGTPVVLAVLSRKFDPAAVRDNALIAQTAAVLSEVLA
ncbi:class A beta-lactamase [Streptomyces sp. JB150]|uniref:class A beta-lactamase n=1 Tax=Streptomyces sp. JB150 TaxID=2714844 RepID=UPI0014099286|nr:class A beta-lactamase [Streptomyces sp. JB150]QIJ62485.1 class A beta-lactamase [Streptomyces sp. JB150]